MSDPVATDATVAPDPTTAIVMTGLRDAVKLGGAYLVANGVASSSDVQLWGGFAVIIGGVVWSGIVSWMKTHKRTIALTAVTQLSGGNIAAANAAITNATATVNALKGKTI